MKNNLEQKMTSDVKDIAISRVVDAISKVDAWNIVDCVTELGDFCLKYGRTIRTISNLKKIRDPAKFRYYKDIDGDMLENEGGVSLTNRILETCDQYQSRRFTDGEFDPYATPRPFIAWAYSLMAIRAIQHIEGADQYLDKSVEELQSLAEGDDLVATAMLTVVKVLNWNSNDK
jgi:hypothetical protein